MNIRELASLIAKKESKKSQVSIGNVREILGILSDLIYKDESIAALLVANGKRRAKAKKRK